MKILNYKQWKRVNESKIVKLNEWYSDQEEFPVMHILGYTQPESYYTNPEEYRANADSAKVITDLDELLDILENSSRLGDLAEALDNFAREHHPELDVDNADRATVKEVIGLLFDKIGVSDLADLVNNYTMSHIDTESSDWDSVTPELVNEYTDELKSKGFKYWDTVNMDGYNPVFISKKQGKVGQLEFNNDIESLDELLLSMFTR